MRLLEAVVCGAGARDRQPRYSRCRRAPHHPAGLERHRARDPVRHPAGAVRGAGRAHARRGGGGVRGREPHLCASSMRAPTSWRITCARSACGPETVVGLCVERSPEMLVGLLGILKAGGAYLPLDPDYPPERLAFMLEDAGAPVLVTHAALLDRLPSHDARASCASMPTAPAIARQPSTAPASRLKPQNTAYVIYTSGSTGTPKGVVVAHSNVAAARHQRELRRADARRRGSADGAADLRRFDLRDLGCAAQRCELVVYAGWPFRHLQAQARCRATRASACCG